MRGKGEGCLVTELQAIMAPSESWGWPHNAKHSVTGRLCQYYKMYIKLYNVYYKCPPQVRGVMRGKFWLALLA